MQLDVLNIQGKSTGRSIELPAEIFGIEPNTHVMYLAVKQYLAHQRQGTSKTKTRMEVKGSSKKLHKQKGTGGSRKGNIRNPIFKGGGTIFGPEPRKYTIKLNKKVKDLARISALSQKVKDNAIMIVEDFNFETPTTKNFATALKDLNLNRKKSLFLVPEINENLLLSARNIPNTFTMLLSDVNTYDLMHAQVIVLSESAAKIFIEEETTETE
jgi:large subunit ribosomal protein L4